jgi:hypothetical protein
MKDRYRQVYDRLEFVPHRAPKRLSRGFFESLDSGIAEAVAILDWHGIETCQSCQGGLGHSYPEPTVDFIGDAGAGMRALGIATMYALPVVELRQKWRVEHGRPVEMVWQLVFDDRGAGYNRRKPAKAETTR